MPGWIPITADDWFIERTQIEGEWPTVLVITDLRFWDNPLACSKRKRPTVKALRETWGWSQGKAYRFIMSPDKWLDPGTKKSKEGGTPAENDGTPPKNDGTGDGVSTGTNDDDRNEGGTDAERERNDIETPLIETHARTHTPALAPTDDGVASPQAATGQPPAGSKKTAKVIPSDLLDAYNAYRTASGITRISKLDPRKGMGLKLWGIHESCRKTEDDAVALFQWLEKSQNGRAPWYRENQKSAGTVLVKLDGLLDEMSAKPVTPANKSTASHGYSSPADRWEDVLQRHGYAAGWHERIEPELRDRYRWASGKVGGPSALGGISWKPDVQKLKDRFNEAYSQYEGQ